MFAYHIHVYQTHQSTGCDKALICPSCCNTERLARRHRADYPGLGWFGYRTCSSKRQGGHPPGNLEVGSYRGKSGKMCSRWCVVVIIPRL